VTLYEVYFRRLPLKDSQELKDSIRRAQIALRETETSREVPRVKEETEEGNYDIREVKENLFVDEHLEEEEEQEEMIITEPTQRVKEHIVKQQANIEKKERAREPFFLDAQEVATLQIAKQYRFSAERLRIPIKILEHAPAIRLPFLDIWTRLALFGSNGMYHSLVRVLRSVGCIPLASVIADRITKVLSTSNGATEIVPQVDYTIM